MLKYEYNMSFYGFGHQQDILTFIKLLEEKGYTLEDTKNYIEWKTKQLTESTNPRLMAQRQDCPECPGKMLLYKVNINNKTQTGDPTDKAVWLCQNNDCMHTIYLKEDEIPEELKER